MFFSAMPPSQRYLKENCLFYFLAVVGFFARFLFASDPFTERSLLFAASFTWLPFGKLCDEEEKENCSN